MSTTFFNRPKFSRHQVVRFVGGVGEIQDIQRQDNVWTYTIKMSMGAKPNFGRVGAETTIVLEEQDIRQAKRVLN